MVSLRPLYVAVLALCLAAPLKADEQSDSLAYSAKRQMILEHGPDEREGAILSAAEDLAHDGYYSEALDLIFSMQDSAKADWEDAFDQALDAAIKEKPLPSKTSRPFGYVQSGLDYERWDGLDTTLTGHVRAKLEWDPPGRTFERLAAVAQGSDRNAYFDFTAKGSLAKRLLRFETEALVEKLFWRDYRDSLDRLFLQLKLEPTTRPLGKPLAAEAPAFLETEQYRYERFGSPSHWAAGIAPGLQAMSENTAKSILLSWDLRAYDYPGTPGASYFRDGPVASGWWYGDRVALDAETRFATTRYRRDTSLTRDRRLETLAGGFWRVWKRLKLGLRVAGETEMEDYEDSIRALPVEYRLEGSNWSAQPQISADWGGAYSASAGITYARAHYPLLREAGGLLLDNPLFLNTSSEDWKAEAGFTMLTKAIFLTLSAEYEVNTVPTDPSYIVGSSTGVGASANINWKLRPWFEIECTVSATRRLWLAYGFSAGNITGNTQVTLGVTSAFP